MHGESQIKNAADLPQMLHLLNATPVMRIAEDNLHSIGSDSLRQVGESGNGHIARQRRLHSRFEQFTSDSCHTGNAGRWIFEVAAIAKLFAQCFPDLNRGFDRPRAVRIEANRNLRTELCAKLPNGFDLLCRIEYARLELDLAKS